MTPEEFMKCWKVNDHDKCKAGSGSSGSSGSSSSSEGCDPSKKQGVLLYVAAADDYCGAGMGVLELDSIGRPCGFHFIPNIAGALPDDPTAEPGPPFVPPLTGTVDWIVNNPDHGTKVLEEGPRQEKTEGQFCIVEPTIITLEIRCTPRTPLGSSSSSSSSSPFSSSSGSSSNSSSSSKEHRCRENKQGKHLQVLIVDEDTCEPTNTMLEIDSVARTAKLVPGKCMPIRKRIVTDVYCSPESGSSGSKGNGSSSGSGDYDPNYIEYSEVVFPPGYLFCVPIWIQVGCCWWRKEQWVYPPAGAAFCDSISTGHRCGPIDVPERLPIEPAPCLDDTDPL